MKQLVTSAYELITELETLPGFYLQAQFEYDRYSVAPVCYTWAITDSAGTEIGLAGLNYTEFRNTAAEVTELIDTHLDIYADRIEQDYVDSKVS